MIGRNEVGMREALLFIEFYLFLIMLLLTVEYPSVLNITFCVIVFILFLNMLVRHLRDD